MDRKPNQALNNFNDLCRVCLEKSPSLSLFSAVYDDGETFNLWEVYENCADIELEENDEFPKAVCDDCLVQLVSVHNLAKKCKNANVKLYNLKQNPESYVTVKNEPDLIESKDRVLLDSQTSYDDVSKVEEIAEQIIMKNKNYIDPQLLFDDNIEVTHGDESEPEEENVEEDCKYYCKVCLKVCMSKNGLIDHLRSHTQERPYQCKECDATFTLYCNLRRHVRIHTGIKPFICNVCNKGFTQATSLNSHMRLHNGDKPYICRCGKTFHQDTLCTASLRRYVDKTSGKKLSKQPDVCKECNTIYTRNCKINNHTSYESESRFLCSMCGKEYVSKMGLSHHLLTHTGERPHKCKFCSKSFKNSASLRLHTLIHTGERPCVCTICGKCFIQPAHLRYHMLLHTGVKEYSCTYCKKAFALKGNLTQHMRTHTDSMPFECDECDKRFRSTSSLKKHKKMHEKKKENIEGEVE